MEIVKEIIELLEHDKKTLYLDDTQKWVYKEIIAKIKREYLANPPSGIIPTE